MTLQMTAIGKAVIFVHNLDKQASFIPWGRPCVVFLQGHMIFAIFAAVLFLEFLGSLKILDHRWHILYQKLLNSAICTFKFFCKYKMNC